MNWNQLGIEIGLLRDDTQKTLIPCLTMLDNVLLEKTNRSSVPETIQSLVAEIKQLCKDYGEMDRLSILNDFFFNEKKFKIHDHKVFLQEKDWLLSTALNQRQGGFLPLAFVYQHLAHAIDIPAYIVGEMSFQSLKLTHKGTNYLIQLNNKGRTEKEAALKITDSQNPTLAIELSLDILSLKNSMKVYYTMLLEHYCHQAHLQKIEKMEALLKEFGAPQTEPNPFSQYPFINATPKQQQIVH